MKDIFALEVFTQRGGSMKMLVSANTFTGAVAEAEAEYIRWWEEYCATPKGVALGAPDRKKSEITNVTLVHRYSSNKRLVSMGGGLRHLLRKD